MPSNNGIKFDCELTEQKGVMPGWESCIYSDMAAQGLLPIGTAVNILLFLKVDHFCS